ncbi:MAG: hypothetical protein AAFS07_18910 [Pseudomonadota bacterium]
MATGWIYLAVLAVLTSILVWVGHAWPWWGPRRATGALLLTLGLAGVLAAAICAGGLVLDWFG